MPARSVSRFLHGRQGFYLALLLAPPLLWLGTVYLGSLFTLLALPTFYLLVRGWTSKRTTA